MPEIWKPIPGYEGRYEASDQGQIRSVPRQVRSVSKHGREFWISLNGRVLRPGDCKGYDIVNLSVENRPNMERVHRLVALTFVVGGPLPHVNHKNGNKRDNRAENLEWCDARYNLNHAVDMGLSSQAIRVVHPVTGEIFPSITRAVKASHLSDTTISKKWKRA